MSKLGSGKGAPHPLMGGLDPAGKAVGDTCAGSEPGGVHTAPPSAPRNPQCDHSALLGRGRVSFQGPPCLQEQCEAAGMGGGAGAKGVCPFLSGFPRPYLPCHSAL